MKRLISIILCISFIWSCGSAFAAVTDRNAEKNEDNALDYDTYGYREAELLKKIGIIDEILSLDEEMERGEFCSLIVRILPEGLTSDTELPFVDIDENYKYIFDIKALYSNGYISGYGDGFFRPKNILSFEEAAAIFIRILGCDNMVKNFGYTGAALKIGLNRGVKNTGNALTRADVYRLAKNALDADIMSYNDGEYTQKDKTLFEDRFNIYKYEGTVTDNGITAITQASSVNDGELVIDGITFEYDSTNAYGLLGYYVKGYYKYIKEEGRNIIISVEVDTSKTESLEVLSAEIDTFTLTSLSYTKKNTSKTVKISPEADYIYNGMAAGTLKQTDLDGLTLGDVRLIDSDKNGVYDITFINSYKSMVVSNVYIEEEWVFGKYNEKIDLSEFERYKIFRDDKEIELGELHDFDVITILENKKSWTAWVVNKAAYGTVSGSSNEDDYTIYVDGIGYTYAKEYAVSTASKPQVGETGMFYFTNQNQIVYYEKTAVDELAYLHRLFDYENDDGLEVTAAEFYGADGVWKKFECADRVSVNGISIKREDLTSNSLLYNESGTVRQPVTYRINNENKLSAIDVPNPNKPDDDVLQSGGAYTLLHFSNGTGTAAFFGSDRINYPVFLVGNNITCFKVPQNPEQKEYYSVENGFNGENDTNYENIEGFYTSLEAKRLKNVDIIVRSSNGSAGIVDSGGRLSVVKSINYTVNDDGEACHTLNVLRRGIEYTYRATDGKTINGIKPGDLIVVYWDGLGNLSGYKKIYSPSENIGIEDVYFSGPNAVRPESDIIALGKKLWGIDNFAQYDDKKYYVGDFSVNADLSSPANAAYYKRTWYDSSYWKGTVTYKNGNTIEFDSQWGVCPLVIKPGAALNYYSTAIHIVELGSHSVTVKQGTAADICVGDYAYVNVTRAGIMDMFIYRN